MCSPKNKTVTPEKENMQPKITVMKEIEKIESFDSVEKLQLDFGS